MIVDDGGWVRGGRAHILGNPPSPESFSGTVDGIAGLFPEIPVIRQGD